MSTEEPSRSTVLDAEQLRAVYYCVSEVTRRRSIGGQPIPGWLRRIDAQLRAALIEGMSSTRLENGCATGESKDVWIGSPQAAALLGWTVRQVQRLASDLDGQLISGRWAFPRAAVMAYAEGMNDV